MELEKVLCCMFMFFVLALTLHKTLQLFTTDRGKTKKRVGYVTRVCV